MALKGAKEVIVFEPMPVNTQKIKNFIALNSDLPVTLIEKAVSNKSGKTVFNIMPEDTMGKLDESPFEADAETLQQVEVTTDTIDNIVTYHPEPDLIKIDVEGAEELVLKGGLELLKRKKPVLMIEVHSHAIGKNCYELLKNTYQNIYVFETGRAPGNGEDEICHYIAIA
jgi:FkbM family methyltransferase